MPDDTESEHLAQRRVFNWAKVHSVQYPELRLLYAIPNQGKRSYTGGAWMKAEGLKPGVPDMCLPIPHGPHHAMYIELKVGRNQPTDEQEWWQDQLCSYGNLAVTLWGSQAAIEAIKDYIRWEEE